MAKKSELEKALVPGWIAITDLERAEWLASRQGVVLSSDAFIPFRDNLDRAAVSGVYAIAQAGGSARDQGVTDAANQHNMVMCHTGVRLFLH